jgi:hypothetical protein
MSAMLPASAPSFKKNLMIILWSYPIRNTPMTDVKGKFWMEYDQRVIIKFLLNEGIDAHGTADRL